MIYSGEMGKGIHFIFKRLRPLIQGQSNKILMLSAIAISTDPSEWTILKYNKISPNKLSKDAEGLWIDVASSASPVVHAFEKPLALSKFYLKFSHKGRPNIVNALHQGEGADDDFLMRFGLVVEGDTKLNFVQRMLAPEWLKSLEGLSTNCAGVKKVDFFSVANTADLPWKKRKHPLSDLLEEQIVSLAKGDSGSIEMTQSLNTTQRVCALWLGADGDGTKSSFTVHIHEILLYE